MSSYFLFIVGLIISKLETPLHDIILLDPSICIYSSNGSSKNASINLTSASSIFIAPIPVYLNLLFSFNKDPLKT
jgi:hypothetical protein